MGVEKGYVRPVWMVFFGFCGLALNLVPIETIRGFLFFFGGVLALVPGLAYGPLIGAGALALAGLPLLIVWGEPFWFVYYTVHGLLLCWYVHRREGDVPTGALLSSVLVTIGGLALAWIAGTPVSLRLHGLLLGLAGINATAVSMLSDLIVHSWWVQRRFVRRLLPSRPFQTYISHLFTPLIALSVIGTTALFGQLQTRSLSAEVQADTYRTVGVVNRTAASRVATYLTDFEQAVTAWSDRIQVEPRLAAVFSPIGADDSPLVDMAFFPAAVGQRTLDDGTAVRVLDSAAGAGAANYGDALRFFVPVRDGSQTDGSPAGWWVGWLSLETLADDATAADGVAETVLWADRSVANDIDETDRPFAYLQSAGDFSAIGWPADWSLTSVYGSFFADRRFVAVPAGDFLYGGTIFIERDLVPAMEGFLAREGSIVLGGFLCLIAPLILTPWLLRWASVPVSRLSRALSEFSQQPPSSIKDMLPPFGDRIDEVRKLTAEFQLVRAATRDMEGRVQESREALAQILMATLQARDAETADHSRRVVYYSLRLARELDVGDRWLPHIRWGALLHDIGKIGVPDAILQKNGYLTKAEWAIMRTHCELGYEIISHVKSLAPAVDIIRYHHERWDGAGYPHGLAREDIPLPARIFSVADALDAMTTTRVYRPVPFSFEQALAELVAMAGTQFDPSVVAGAVRIGAAEWEALGHRAKTGDGADFIRELVTEEQAMM